MKLVVTLAVLSLVATTPVNGEPRGIKFDWGRYDPNQDHVYANQSSLRHRIELFSETGRVFRAPSELFAENAEFRLCWWPTSWETRSWGREHRGPTTRSRDVRRAILQGA